MACHILLGRSWSRPSWVTNGEILAKQILQGGKRETEQKDCKSAYANLFTFHRNVINHEIIQIVSFHIM